MSARPPIEPRDLGDGLLVRSTTRHDAERVGQLAAHIFRPSPDAPLNARQLPRTLELASGLHPLSGPGHGIVVEHTGTHELIASLWALPTVWEYDGIAFAVGRPEQVVCQPRYRGRGVVRAMFDAFHAQSAGAGELAQAITGISYYYRRYGYEYAVERDQGHTLGFDAIMATPTAGYRLRDATPDDVPSIAALYDAIDGTSPLRTRVSPRYWRWTLFDADPRTNDTHTASVLLDAAGAVCGYALYRARRYGAALDVEQVVVAPERLPDALDAILHGLRERALCVPIRDGGEDTPPVELAFQLGTAHPLYPLLADRVRVEPPYAWYVRVGDVPAFLAHVRPALERRLARSAMVGYDGEILVTAYDYGVRLGFADGRLATIAPWRRTVRPVPGPEAHAALPPFAFLQLVFGYRDLDTLLATYPDAKVLHRDVGRVLRALFPARPSFVMEQN